MSRNEIEQLQNKLKENKEDIKNLEKQISNLEGELEVCYMEIDFIDDYVVFIEDDGTNLYHKYQCYRFTANSFYVFNIDYAVGEGYVPCQLCNP